MVYKFVAFFFCNIALDQWDQKKGKMLSGRRGVGMALAMNVSNVASGRGRDRDKLLRELPELGYFFSRLEVLEFAQ